MPELSCPYNCGGEAVPSPGEPWASCVRCGALWRRVGGRWVEAVEWITGGRPMRKGKPQAKVKRHPDADFVKVVTCSAPVQGRLF